MQILAYLQPVRNSLMQQDLETIEKYCGQIRQVVFGNSGSEMTSIVSLSLETILQCLVVPRTTVPSRIDPIVLHWEGNSHFFSIYIEDFIKIAHFPPLFSESVVVQTIADQWKIMFPQLKLKLRIRVRPQNCNIRRQVTYKI